MPSRCVSAQKEVKSRSIHLTWVLPEQPRQLFSPADHTCRGVTLADRKGIAVNSWGRKRGKNFLAGVCRQNCILDYGLLQNMGSICSGALQTGHTSMQAFVSAEKFLQQEHTMNRHGISFCNTCAGMFLMKVSIMLKKNVEIPTIWEQSEVGEQPNMHNYNKKILILQLAYRS